MKQKSKVYFTSGEFAKLCGTTKETLRHYDSIGLLRPECRGANGYGYYAAGQFFDFDLIDTLKEANCSLKEIGEYLGNHNTGHFVAFLKEKEKELAAERERLERMQRFLRRTVETTEYAMYAVYGVPEARECQEEFLIALELPEGEEITLVEMIDRMREHSTYVDDRKLGEEYQMGTIVLRETLEAGQCFDSYYYTKIPEYTDSERLMLKPAGTYATMLYKGAYRDMPEAYRVLKEFIQEQGLRICGHSYEYDMVTHLATEDVKDYITQISIQVERGGG